MEGGRKSFSIDALLARTTSQQTNNINNNNNINHINNNKNSNKSSRKSSVVSKNLQNAENLNKIEHFAIGPFVQNLSAKHLCNERILDAFEKEKLIQKYGETENDGVAENEENGEKVAIKNQSNYDVCDFQKMRKDASFHNTEIWKNSNLEEKMMKDKLHNLAENQEYSISKHQSNASYQSNDEEEGEEDEEKKDFLGKERRELKENAKRDSMSPERNHGFSSINSKFTPEKLADPEREGVVRGRKHPSLLSQKILSR